MYSSIIIGKIIGTYLFIFSLAMLLNKPYYDKVVKEILQKPAFLTFSGFFTLILGLTIIIFHNIWNQGWEMLITIIGWIFFIQGISRLTFPTSVISIGKKLNSKQLTLFYWSSLLIGGYLAYMSFYN